MPFVNNPIDGTEIHYEVEGSGPPLVLVHGFGGSVQGWTEHGYVGALGTDYRLVMYDVRAHGESGHPHGLESYSPELHAGDIRAILDDLGIEKTHLLGYSSGAWIGFTVLRYAPERLLSLVAGGCYPQPMDDSPVLNRLVELWQGSLESALSAIEKNFGPMPEERRSLFMSQDRQARLDMITRQRDSTGVDDTLTSTRVPVLAYSGTEDPHHDLLAEAADLIPSANMVSLKGMDHAAALREVDEVLPHVRKFLADVESANASD